MGVLRVSLRNILTVEAYEQGLRVKIMRLFGPFSPPFFVPWKDIRIERKQGFFLGGTIFYFGDGGPFSKMGLEGDVADNLWRDAGELWPEKGPPPGPAPRGKILAGIFWRWLVYTSLAAAFFIIAPIMALPDKPEARPPILVAILFPAIAIGFFSVFEFFQKVWRQRRKK